MIKINLVAKKKRLHVPVVLGINFNKINFIALGISLVILKSPNWVLVPGWEAEKEVVVEELSRLNGRLREVNREIQENSHLQEQLDAFNRQIARLEARSQQVQEIINRRTNPRRVLELMARNTPDQLWYDEMLISNEKEITITGSAQNYRSIGDFITRLNESPFFGRSISLDSTGTREVRHGSTEVRVEDFVVSGRIITYDPF